MSAPRVPVEPSTAARLGAELYGLVAELYPICRSITGDGVRETLRRIQQRLPLDDPRSSFRHAGVRLDGAARVEHPRCLDQEPERRSGRRFSAIQSARRELQRAGSEAESLCRSCRQHLHTLPEHPELDSVQDLVLQRDLGFLRQRRAGADADRCGVRRLHRLDAGRRPPDLRRVLSAWRQSSDEVLLSCHVCHPSLCNDNLSGISVAVAPRPLAVDACRPVDCPTGFCSFRAPSGRSPGWRGIRTGWRRFATGWCSPASAGRGIWSTSAAGAARPRSTARPPTC